MMKSGRSWMAYCQHWTIQQLSHPKVSRINPDLCVHLNHISSVFIWTIFLVIAQETHVLLQYHRWASMHYSIMQILAKLPYDIAYLSTCLNVYEIVCFVCLHFVSWKIKNRTTDVYNNIPDTIQISSFYPLLYLANSQLTPSQIWANKYKIKQKTTQLIHLLCRIWINKLFSHHKKWWKKTNLANFPRHVQNGTKYKKNFWINYSGTQNQMNDGHGGFTGWSTMDRHPAKAWHIALILQLYNSKKQQ